jgi:hypothetical protein
MSAATGMEMQGNIRLQGEVDPKIAEFKAPRDLGKFISCRLVQALSLFLTSQ